jgi:hypothetical protein
MERTVSAKWKAISAELSHGADRWSFPVFANGPSCGTHLSTMGGGGDGEYQRAGFAFQKAL